MTDAGSEPLTDAELKAHLRVDHSDEDALITSINVAARQLVEKHTARDLKPRTYDMALRRFPRGFDVRTGRSGTIVMPRPPLTSVTSISYIDRDGASVTVDGAVYGAKVDVEPGQVFLKHDQDWPTDVRDQVDAVTVRFVTGYATAGDVPDVLKSAIRLIAGRLYEFREEFIAGTIIAKVPGGAEALMSPYTIEEIAA